MHPVVIARWHEIVRSHDASALADLLADDVVFASPVVHTPQLGRALTLRYLGAALKVLNNGSFKYLNEWHGAHSAVLEFEATCEDILINGVDIVSWNDDQKITAFKVMVRPLKAINKLHELMARQLTPA